MCSSDLPRIDGVGNGISCPYDEKGINHTDGGTGYFVWPSRDIAEKYMQSLLQAQLNIEDKENAATSFTYRNEGKVISFSPLPEEEAAYMQRGHYELHRVTGVAMRTKKNTAGWQINDMMIDPEVLVEMRSDEPALAIHYDYKAPAIHRDAWAHRI